MSSNSDATWHGACDLQLERVSESLRLCVRQRDDLERKVTGMRAVAVANEQVIIAQRDRVKALEARIVSLTGELREAGRRP